MNVKVERTGRVLIRATGWEAARLAGRTDFGDVSEAQRELLDKLADAWYAAGCPPYGADAEQGAPIETFELYVESEYGAGPIDGFEARYVTGPGSELARRAEAALEADPSIERAIVYRLAPDRRYVLERRRDKLTAAECGEAER